MVTFLRTTLLRLLGAAMLAAPLPALAAACASIASTNWSLQTTWGPAGTGCVGAPGGIPGAADDVTISNGNAVNVNVVSNARSIVIATGVTATSLTLAANLTVATTVTMNAPTAAVTKQIVVGANTLAVTGNVTINGGTGGAGSINRLTVTIGIVTIGGALAINSGTVQSNAQVTLTTGRITVAGNTTLTGGAAANQAAQLNITGASAAGNGVIIGGTLNLLSIAAGFGGSASVTMSSTGIISVAGAGGVTNRGSISIGAGTFTLTGASAPFVTTNAGAAVVSGVTSTTVTSGTLTIPGNATVAAGVVNPSGATMSVTTGTITVSGNLFVTAGNNVANVNSTVSVTTGRINVTGNTTVTGGNANTRDALLRATGVPTVGGIGINIGGDLTVAASVATSSAVTLGAGSVINVAGDVTNGDTITVGAGTFNATGATKTFRTTSNTNVSSTTVAASGQLIIAGNAAASGGSAATTGASMAGGPGTITITGNATVTGGSGSPSAATMSVTTGSLSITGNATVTGGSGITSGATMSATTGTLAITGDATVTGGSANPSIATMSVTNTTGTLTVGGNLAINAGTTDNASARVSVITGSITVNGDATVTGSASAAGGLRTATLLVSGAPAGVGIGLTINGNLNILSHAITPTAQTAFAQISATGGVINVAGNVNNGDTILLDAGIFTVTGAGSTFTNSNAATAAWTRVTSGLLDISGDTGTLTNAANELLSVTLDTGRITVGNTTTHTGSLTNSGTIALTLAGTVNANGSFTNSGTFTNNASGQLFLRGATSTVNGTFTPGTGTVTMAGVAAQTLSGTGLSGVNSLNNLTITNTNGVALNSNAIVTAPGILTMNGVGTVLTPAAAVVVSGTGTLTGTGTVQVTRTMATADFASQYTITTKTLTNLTVEYIATATQAVNALTYGSGTGGGLKISNTSATGATVAAAGVVVNGTLTMNGTASLLNPVATAIVNGTGTLTGTGTVQVTRTAATADFVSQYTMTTKTLTNLTVEYVGAAAQVVNALTYGSGTGGGLKINNSTGVTLAGDATAGGLLSLTSGVVTTGAAITLISSADCPGSVARNSGHVAGNLRLRVPGAGSVTCIFDIGDAAGYRPLSVAFTTLSAAGDVTAAVSQANGDTTNIGTSSFDPLLTVNRFWTLANTTTNFASAIATFSWLAGDVDPGADPLAFVVGRFSGGWTYLTTLPASLSAQATGLSAATLAGEFAIGETVMTLYSHWRMDESAWSGSANEVVDSGTGANHGTASGLAPTKPTTAIVSPALGNGVSGTCSYGVFNRANKDYVALPGSYPNLMSAAGGFTITAWIRTTDSTLGGQRIMLDDQNNSSPGGWGFSVGDEGGAGRLRFFYRQASVFILETGNVISNNTWYFVAASISLAAGANASRATLYVYNTAGTLVTSATNTFTWDAGSDGGPSSIGGETNASGENSSSFGFGGNIDEVRVYQAALSAGQIDRVRQETRACPIVSFNHIRIEHGGVGLTCTPATITVKACLDVSCSSTFGSSVTTTLSPTGWIGGDAVAITGSLSPQLRRTVAGTITLGASGTAPAPATAARCFNNGTEGPNSCDFEFKTAGFIFDVPDLTACKPSTSVTITAVRADLTSQACVPAFDSGLRSVNFWTTYSSPLTGTLQAEVNGTPVGTSSPGTGINLTFSTGAVSTFTVRYPDAGQMQLNARYNPGSGTEAGLDMTGVDTFVSAPVGLAVIPIGGACVAGDATCAVFKKAGESFDHTVKAACWTSDGDTDLSDNPVTPNFLMDNIPLSANLVAPTGGNSASLGAATVSFVGVDVGSKTVSQTISEVGVFTISATPAVNAYFGIITVPGGTSPNIGRFRPDHFALTGVAATLTNRAVLACAPTASSFSHMGEGMDLVFSLRAENAANVVTQNYRTSGTAAQNFAKLSAASPSAYDFGARSGTTILTGRISSIYPGSAPTFVAGVLALTAANPVRISVGRNNSGVPPQDNPDGPYAATAFGIKPVDSDLVAMGGALDLDADAVAGFERKNLGVSTELRFGRLRLSSAVGSEKLALQVPMETQYWSGATFTRNTDDSCTTFARSAIILDGYSPPAFVPSSGSGNCKTFVQQDPITFSSGRGTLTLAAPAGGAAGSLRLTPNLGTVLSGSYCDNATSGEDTASAASLSYLLGRWNDAANPDSDANTAFDDNPGARASFGVYGAQPRNFIFFRENY